MNITEIIEDFKGLDANDPGTWPKSVKIVVFIVVFIAVLVAGWHLDVTKQRQQLANLVQQEKERIQQLDIKQQRVANLALLEEQLQEIKQSFGDMVQQLPDQTEVAGLLVDISQVGLAAGLEFKLFQPQDEQPIEFYAILPIEIDVVGGYHQFGEFVSGIAALPRIVTIHDIDIRKEQNVLQMNMIARTYRAIEGDEDSESY